MIKSCGKCGKEMELSNKQANRKYCSDCQRMSNYYIPRIVETQHKFVKSRFFRGLEVKDDIIGRIMLGKDMRQNEYYEEGAQRYEKY